MDCVWCHHHHHRSARDRYLPGSRVSSLGSSTFLHTARVTSVCYWIKSSHSPELWLWWWRSNAGGCCCAINCWAQASDNSAARSQASLTICQEEVQAAQHFRIFSRNLHGFKQMWALNTHELEQVVIRRWWDGQGRGGSYLGTDYGRREEAGWLINYWRKCGTLWNIRHDIIWNKNITRLNTPSITQPTAWRRASSWMFGEKEDQIAELTKTQSRQGWNIMRVWSLRILDINYVMACKKLSLQASMLLEAVRPPQPNKPSTKCQCHPFILFRDFNSAKVSIVYLHFALKILWMICVELFTENQIDTFPIRI